MILLDSETRHRRARRSKSRRLLLSLLLLVALLSLSYHLGAEHKASKEQSLQAQLDEATQLRQEEEQKRVAAEAEALLRTA